MVVINLSPTATISSSTVSGGVQQSLAACSSSPPLALPFCPSVPSSNGDSKVSDIKAAPLFSCLLLRLLPRSCQTTSKTAVKRLAGREARSTIFSVLLALLPANFSTHHQHLYKKDILKK
ncbi:hypothetical protein ACFX2J_046330 [Malus domestica]